APLLLFAARPLFLFRLSGNEFFIAPVFVKNRDFQFPVHSPFTLTPRNRYLHRWPWLMSWMLASSCLHKLSPGYVVHGQSRGIHGDLGDVFFFALHIGLQAELFGARFDRVHEFSDQRALHAGPICELVHQRFAMFLEQSSSGAYALLAPPADLED